MAGFTLLEVLIAMTLLGVMMVLIFGVLRVSVRSWESGEYQASKVSRRMVLQNFLRSHLSRIKPWEDDFSDEEPVLSFQGDARSVQFVSVLPLHNRGVGGWHRFKLRLVRNRNGDTDLIVALEPFFPARENEQSPIDDVVLLENVETMRFSYFGSQDADEAPQWFDEWLDQSFLPAMIQMEIKPVGEPAWPPLVVAPKLATVPDSST